MTEQSAKAVPESADGEWRLVRPGEVAPVEGGHGSWVESDHPAVVACMGSVHACAEGGCQYRRVSALPFREEFLARAEHDPAIAQLLTRIDHGANYVDALAHTVLLLSRVEAVPVARAGKE